VVKDTVHKLLEVLRKPDLSGAFKARAQELLEAHLCPHWPQLPELPSGEEPLLTIAMATYDDYDGVYFSIQALRLYHPEVLDRVEFLVLDNNPESASGKAVAEFLKYVNKARYVPFTLWSGTAVREILFRFAHGRFVLCMDCHVLLSPGSLARLVDYLETNPECDDLLQGPLVRDDLKDCSTHLQDEWRACFWGTWATDQRGLDPDAEPFEIPMQGLGVFCSRRASWPGFDPRTVGFGGEEGSLHERFRKRGNRALCLPFLRWLHRFARPLGVPYENSLNQRFRNFLMQFEQSGLGLDPMLDHFREKMEKEAFSLAWDQVKAETSHPSYRYEALYLCLEGGAADCQAVAKADPLFFRAVAKELACCADHPGLPLVRALTRAAHEACLLGLQTWCLVWGRDLTKEELEARLELLQGLQVRELWEGTGRFVLDPRCAVWKFDRASTLALREEVPQELEMLVGQEWGPDRVASLLKDAQCSP
jgi:hypothetical protein